MNDHAYGPVGTRPLIENDLFTVWEIRLQPNEQLAMHHHELPYLVAHTSSGNIRVTEHDGTEIERDVTAGEVDWHPVGEIHELVNLSEHLYSNVVVELKPHRDVNQS